MRALAIAGCVLLAACSSEGERSIVQAGLGRVVERVQGAGPAEAPAASPRVLTREDLEAAGTALVRVRVVDGGRPTLFHATAVNNGVVSFSAPLREIVGLRGTQIVSTRGLGTDLLSAWSSADDPLTRPTPPDSWPAEVTRVYEFPDVGARGRIEQYTCTFEVGAASAITIVARTHEGVEVSETCTGPAGTFENLHFADIRTGYVWRSLQWTGPQGLLDMEVVIAPGE
jgi:hypothetical protein